MRQNIASIKPRGLVTQGPHRPRLFPTILLAVMSLGVGCSSSSTSNNKTTDGGTDAGPTAGQACGDSAHASCTKRDSCSLTSFLNTLDYGSETICETRTALACVADLGSPGDAQNPTHIEACVAQYANYDCVDYLTNNPSGACVPPAGTLAMGAACGASGQCQSAYCAVSQNQVCGTCQPLPVAGATCQVTGDCGRDLNCAIPTGMTTGTCAAYGAASAMCLTGTAPCAPGLACVGDDETTGAMGTCQAQGTTVGATCDPSRKTSANCEGDLGLICIPTAAGSMMGTCQAITFTMTGTCGDVGASPITGYVDCQAGGLCVKASSTATTGTCSPPAADGAACDSALGPPCLSPAKCVPTADGGTAGTCTLPNANNCH